MTDAHTPRLLSDADAAAYLAGLPRPVSSEEALQKIDKAWRVVTSLCDGTQDWTMNVPARPDSDPDLVIGYALRCARDLVFERDALAVRVRELEAERAELRGAIDDAAYQYSQYIVEDTAHCTLTEHMLSAFDAAITTPESKP